MTEPAPQTGDARESADVKPSGDAPALALASLYQAFAQSMALTLQNAASAQGNLNILAQAALAQGIAQIHDRGEFSDAMAIGKTLSPAKPKVPAETPGTSAP